MHKKEDFFETQHMLSILSPANDTRDGVPLSSPPHPSLFLVLCRQTHVHESIFLHTAMWNQCGHEAALFLLFVVPASSINGDDSTKCRMELSFFVAAGCLVGLCECIYTSIYKGIRCLAFHVGRIWRGRRRIKEKRRRVIKWRKKEWKDRVEWEEEGKAKKRRASLRLKTHVELESKHEEEEEEEEEEEVVEEGEGDLLGEGGIKPFLLFPLRCAFLDLAWGTIHFVARPPTLLSFLSICYHSFPTISPFFCPWLLKEEIYSLRI